MLPKIWNNNNNYLDFKPSFMITNKLYLFLNNSMNNKFYFLEKSSFYIKSC
jgi:hypothetical protein